MTFFQSTPRRSAVTSMKASRVNGDGSLSAQEMRFRSTPSRQRSMWSALFTHHAAGAEQLRLDRIHVVAAVDRVARNQRDRGRAARHDAEQALVVVGGRAQADQLPLRPGAAAVHGGVDAAGVVGLAGKAERVGLAVGRPSRPGRRAAGPGCRRRSRWRARCRWLRRSRAPSAPWRRRRAAAANGDSTRLVHGVLPCSAWAPAWRASRA